MWGCKGDEWKEAYDKGLINQAEDYPKERFNKCFEWKLKEGSKVYKIASKRSFLSLVKNYNRYVTQCESAIIYEIDYLKLAQDYDAVEVSAKALQELKEGWDIEDLALSSSKLNHNPWLMLLASYGLVGWDVPSICAFKPDKVEFIREIEG